MEKELLEQFAKARETLERLKDEKSEAEKSFLLAKLKLIEYMSQAGISSTAKHDGIGFVTMEKPVIRASCTVDNKESLFTWLKSIGRDDLIRYDVHPATLSSFVGETLEQGVSMPEFLTYYLEPRVKFYAR